MIAFRLLLLILSVLVGDTSGWMLAGLTSRCSVRTPVWSLHGDPENGVRLRSACSSDDSQNDARSRSDDVLQLMQLSSMHVIPQALRYFVDSGGAAALSTKSAQELDASERGSDADAVRAMRPTPGYKTVAEVMSSHQVRIDQGSDSEAHGIECDTMSRVLRLVAHVGVVDEIDNDLADVRDSTQLFQYRLTAMGELLVVGEPESSFGQNAEPRPITSAWSSMVLHWTEAPLWNSWLSLSASTHVPTGMVSTGSNTSTDSDADAAQNVEDTNSSDAPPSRSPRLTPFERANDSVSSDSYYNRDTAPRSLQYANDFVRCIHTQEIEALVHDFDWSWLHGKTLIDVGGHNGKVLSAILHQHPSIGCICMDLPEIIEQVKMGLQQASSSSSTSTPSDIEFVGGDVLDSASIPNGDAILLKHILDKSMWDHDDSVRLLRSCADALYGRGERVHHNAGENEEDGMATVGTPTKASVQPKYEDESEDTSSKRILIAETVLPNARGTSEVPSPIQFAGGHAVVEGTEESTRHELFLLMMNLQFALVGRQSARTIREWEALAAEAGLEVECIHPTTSPSCSILVLRRQTTASGGCE